MKSPIYPVSHRCGMSSITTTMFLLVFVAGCSRNSPSVYPHLEATVELLVREDGVSLTSPFWATSGFVYYIASPENGDSTELVEFNPNTAEKRLITKGVAGPLAVTDDKRIAAVTSLNRVIVMDSTGTIIWERSCTGSLEGLAFAADGEHLFIMEENALLSHSISVPGEIDTMLDGIDGFRKSPNDSIIIYLVVSQEHGDTVHTFYEFIVETGEKTRILSEGYTGGFDINPHSQNQLAVGMGGEGQYLHLGRQILVYHRNHGIGRIFDAYPYEESSIQVQYWSPDGVELLESVTPYIPGQPLIPLPDELWIARDLY